MAKDILLASDYGLLIKNGDLVIGDCEQQNIDLLLKTDEGQWRASPLTGVGILKWLKATFNFKNKMAAKNRIETKLAADGYFVNEVELNGFEDIRINAER